MSDNLFQEHSLINPYEFLGFDSRNPNISMNQLKSTYYQLALICHPDRGGNPDDMIILQNAYLYIKKQIELKDEKSTTFEDIEKEFKDFIEEQNNIKCPAFATVYDDVHEWRREFNQKFEKNEMDVGSSLLSDGYGRMMDKSLINNINLETNYNSVIFDERDQELSSIPKHQFTSEIVTYTEPMSFNFNQSSGSDLNNTKKSDFTSSIGDLTLSDYKKALTSSNINSIKSDIDTDNSDVQKKFENLMKDRKQTVQVSQPKHYVPPPENCTTGYI